MRQPATNTPSTVETRLRDAAVDTSTYDTYDIEAAERRVAVLALLEEAREHCESFTQPHPEPLPPHDQAVHDLDLAVALILNTPQAAASLARLCDTTLPDPDGATVLGALLHLAENPDAAEYWWQYAAGGDNRTAAFCLYLAHKIRAEHADADHWRRQARRIAPPPTIPAATALPPLLAESVRHTLLAQCHQAMPPTLPAHLRTLIDHLPTADDENYAHIPQPHLRLSQDLRTLASL